MKNGRVYVNLLWIMTMTMTMTTHAFLPQTTARHWAVGRPSMFLSMSEWKDPDGQDSNQWQSDDSVRGGGDEAPEDWQDVLAKKQDGSFWTSFEPSKGADESMNPSASSSASSSTTDIDLSEIEKDMQGDAWLDQLAALSSEEVQYNIKEAAVADKARQMQEWGFNNQAISSTLGVATDSSLEMVGELEGMQAYREEGYLEEIDLETVESHSRVEKDAETGETIRTQMVYVDEHTCIGCTNCATIAQSTFFMHQEHGRARVFEQWGDDQETIQIAIETCPVDCIHYVPYPELVNLEVERRDQNINAAGRLVSQAENGNGGTHFGGGANAFTAPQKISGNMGTRCSNCPSRGCKDCPMYGVGRNPEYEKKEKLRLEKKAKQRLQKEREDKSAEF
jgi:ferredoxin